MDYKTMKLDDIIKWCQDNNQVAWLKDEAARKIDGKRISFVQMKVDFVKKFMPELMPKKEQKPSMYEIIANL